MRPHPACVRPASEAHDCAQHKHSAHPVPQNGGSAAFNKRSTYPRAVQGKKRILVVLFSPFDAKNELNFWNYGEIARDFGGSPIKWVESVVRSSALLSTT